jgi:hypothetical protein
LQLGREAAATAGAGVVGGGGGREAAAEAILKKWSKYTFEFPLTLVKSSQEMV